MRATDETGAAAPDRSTARIKALRGEADRLERLYQSYRLDREFLVKTENARIVYFIDAHDIKGYINPNSSSSLDGFRTEAERECAAEGRDAEIGLRHDQILSGVLFDSAGVVGLLPSHRTEMNHEIAYRARRWLDDSLTLIRNARAEIRRIEEQARRFVRATESDATEESQRTLVHFFQEHAPALTALLREDLDSPRKRLQAVLNDSQLILWDSLEWPDFGIEGDHDGDLSGITPSLECVSKLQEKLTRRRNTVRANWVDASALEQLKRLHEEVDRRTGGSTRVLLVSRAKTLLQAAIELADESGGPLLVRHPRLLALTSAEAGELDQAAGLTLGTALDIYRTHLASLARSQKQGASVVQAAASASVEADDASAVQAAASAFVEAWDTFEKSRLALEAKSRHPVPTADRVEQDLCRRLIDMFSRAKNPEKELNASITKSFVEFGAAATRFLMDQRHLQQPARLDWSKGRARVQVTPLMATSVGPIEIAPWDGMPRDGDQLALQDIADAVRSRGERCLVWSTALACAGLWKQAGFFAQAAQQVAELERSEDKVADEARLLRAEIRRLGGAAAVDPNDGAPSAEQRFELSMKDLSAIGRSNEARRVREEAAQIVEAFLSGVETPGLADLVRQHADRIDRCIDEASDELTKARLIAMLLTMHVAAERRESFWPARTPHDQSAARRRHHELNGLLEKLRSAKQTDALPHRARAIALIGFALWGGREGAQLPVGISLAPPKPGPHDVPEQLRGELPYLIHGLESGSDHIAKLLCSRLKRIAAVLREISSPDLQLAPVRLPAIISRLRAYDPAPFARQALDAYSRTEGVMTAVLRGGLDALHIAPISEAISRLASAIGLIPDDNSDEMLVFHLRMELQMLRLLGASLLPQHNRLDAIAALEPEYRAISRDHPRASLPYIRLQHISHVLEEQETAVELLRKAAELVDGDPYLLVDGGGSYSWLQSFVPRRLVHLTMSSLAEGRYLPGQTSGQDEAGVVAELMLACSSLLDAEHRDSGQPVDEAHELEARRRANNLVFYASRLRAREPERLPALISESKLKQLLHRLLPGEMEAETDLGILHTVGCYYAATDRASDAYRAAAQIFKLVFAGQGKRLHASDADLKEASEWLAPGQQSGELVRLGPGMAEAPMAYEAAPLTTA